MMRACAFAVAMVVVARARAQEPPWAEVLKLSQAAAEEGHVDRALSLAERAWQLVREAGPAHPAYRDAVRDMSMAFEETGRHLRADAIYEQAIAAAHDLSDLQRELQIMHAALLELRQKQVGAEAVWDNVVAREEMQPVRSKAYSAELISLASLKAAMGKHDEAERLYRRAWQQPAISRKDWPLSLAGGCTGPGDRKNVLDPTVALANFLAARGRMDEADEVLRSDKSDAHLQRRIDLLAKQAKWEQAIALQRELAALPSQSDSTEMNRIRLRSLLLSSGQLVDAEPSEEQLPTTDVLRVDGAVLEFGLDEPDKLREALERGDLEGSRSLVLAALDEEPQLAMQAVDVASRLGAAGKHPEMRSVLERFMLTAERLHGSDMPTVLYAMTHSIREYTKAGLMDDARRLLYRLESATLMNAGAQSPEMEEVLQLRAGLLDAEGQDKEGANMFGQWLGLSESLHGAISAEMVAAHRMLAEHYAELKRHAEARAEWLAAIGVSRALYGDYGEEHRELLAAAEGKRVEHK
jgi:tetratricopeptide (TPR) repeat protein